jgi:peptidoglycan hydrolase-like protein with peptidoglycan-binding domain
VSGSKTRRAIRAYEHAHALPQDGRIDQRLLTTMELSQDSQHGGKSVINE